jgi:ubiquinone/menaquinone biosynthesis C-methylase UbiE
MDYDAELQLHNRVLFEACGIVDHDRVIDIGCGTGQTTREAAHIATNGNVIGIDIMERSIERARACAASEGLQNVRFEHGDAQVHEFLPRSFDLVMSRYGTMFFADPVAAFRNLHSALSLEGRLAMMVWQPHEKNEWSIEIEDALAPHFTPQAGDRQHFSLSDPSVVSQVLKGSGFVKVKVDDVREPVYYGSDVEAALHWIRGFRFVQELLRRLDAAANASVLTRLRAMLDQHANDTGVWFDAREWIVTAHAR